MSVNNNPQLQTIGVLAGAGEYPELVIRGAKAAGVRVVCAGFRGSVDKNIRELCDVYAEFRVGEVEAPSKFLVENGAKHVMMAGQIKPSRIYTMWPDATARRLLGAMKRRNAHTIFGTVCQYGAEQGWEVLPSTTFMEAHMPGEGHIAGPAPTEAQMKEARYGMALAREIARLDIGQSIVVQGEKTVCVEAFKGTNECIRSGRGSAKASSTLCKVTKPGHDMRFDVPCLGVGTIKKCIKYNVRHIVFEAGRTILFQRESVSRLCEQHGITLHAIPVPEDGIQLPELPPTTTDADLARELAYAVEKLGLGHSAVVCDGVAIAVEDPQGPLKCLRRAGSYMLRIRIVRLLNWLLNLTVGGESSPPVPMVMACTPQVKLTAMCRLTAWLAGVHLLR